MNDDGINASVKLTLGTLALATQRIDKNLSNAFSEFKPEFVPRPGRHPISLNPFFYRNKDGIGLVRSCEFGARHIVILFAFSCKKENRRLY